MRKPNAEALKLCAGLDEVLTMAEKIWFHLFNLRGTKNGCVHLVKSLRAESGQPDS